MIYVGVIHIPRGQPRGRGVDEMTMIDHEGEWRVLDIVCFYGNDWGQWSKVLPEPEDQGVETPLIFGKVIYFLFSKQIHFFCIIS